MTVEPKWTLVCGLQDIVPNTGVCAKVGKTQVAVFRLVTPNGEEDGVYAIDNFDPRSGANECTQRDFGTRAAGCDW